jgi:transposase
METGRSIGIDVSKDRLDVHVRPDEEAFWLARDSAGVAALVARLTALAPAAIALEATGGFETVVAAALAGAGLPVVVVNPAQVRAFATALGKRAKSDPIDAAVIAHFVEATRPAIRPLADADTRLLADLVARRRQIVAMIGAEHQRQSRAPARVQKSIRRLVAALEKELASIRTSMTACAARPPGAARRTSSPPCRASARPSPAPSSPRCPSSAPSTATRPPPSPASLPGRANPAAGGARASSAAAGLACAPPCSSAPWSPPATTLP